MKKLLLYFLFFVGTALVLIQCGKLFPTTNKIKAHHSQAAITKTRESSYVKNNEVAITGGVIIKTNSNIGSIPAVNHSFLSYRMMLRINGSRMIYNPYLVFKRCTSL